MKLKRVLMSIIVCIFIGTIIIGCERETNSIESPSESSEEVNVPSLYGKVVYVLGDSIPYLSGSWVDTLAKKQEQKRLSIAAERVQHGHGEILMSHIGHQSY